VLPKPAILEWNGDWLLRSAPKSVYSRHRTDRTIRMGDEGWFPARIAADTFFDRFA
jgi:hypothetical protein